MATPFSSAHGDPGGYAGADAVLLFEGRPARILDARVNSGRFWRGSERPAWGIDIDISHRPDLVADNTHMPFADAATAHHTRRRHCYWLVFRKSAKCE